MVPGRTSHYIVRPGRTTVLPSGRRVQAPGRLVPLVAVDQLPPWLEIPGVPRQLTPEQAMNMIAVGGYDDGVDEVVVEEVGEEAGRRGHTTDDGDELGKRDKRDEHTIQPQENTQQQQDDKGPMAAAALDVRMRQPDAAEVCDLDSTGTNTVFPVSSRMEGLESKAAAGLGASVASAAPAPAPVLSAPHGDEPASSNETNIAPRTTTTTATPEPPTKIFAPLPPCAGTPAKDDGGLPSDKSKMDKNDTVVDGTERRGTDIPPNETEDAYSSSSSSSFDAFDAFARVLTSRSSSLTAAPTATATRPPPAMKENKPENTIEEGAGGYMGKPAATAAGAGVMGQGLERKDEADDEGDFLLVDLGLDGVNSWGWSSLPKLVPKKKQPEAQLPTVLDWDCWPEGNNDHGAAANPKAASRANPAAARGRASTQGSSAHPGASRGTAASASRSSAQARAQASKACRNWVAFGKCSYGLNCRYSHTMPETRQAFELMDLSGPPQWWIQQQGLKAAAGKTGLGDGDGEMGSGGRVGDNGSAGGVQMKGSQTPSPKKEKNTRNKKKGNGSGSGKGKGKDKGNSRAAASTAQPQTKLQTPTQAQAQAQKQPASTETPAAPASPAVPASSVRPVLLPTPTPQAAAPAPAYAPAGKNPSTRLSAAGGPAYVGIREVTNLVEL